MCCKLDYVTFFILKKNSLLHTLHADFTRYIAGNPLIISNIFQFSLSRCPLNAILTYYNLKKVMYKDLFHSFPCKRNINTTHNIFKSEDTLVKLINIYRYFHDNQRFTKTTQQKDRSIDRQTNMKNTFNHVGEHTKYTRQHFKLFFIFVIFFKNRFLITTFCAQNYFRFLFFFVNITIVHRIFFHITLNTVFVPWAIP